MTQEQKIAMLTELLNDGEVDMAAVALKLPTYLDFAKREILAHMYWGEIPATVTDVPVQYETVQIMAVVAGFNITGAENQTEHSENGILRHFKYADMVEYIHNFVDPIAIVR